MLRFSVDNLVTDPINCNIADCAEDCFDHIRWLAGRFRQRSKIFGRGLIECEQCTAVEAMKLFHERLINDRSDGVEWLPRAVADFTFERSVVQRA